MDKGSNDRRYVVSDLGFGFAVHDTRDPQQYAFRAGREAKHLSSNRLNSTRVGIYPNFAEALRVAEELNEGDAGRQRAS